MVLAYHAIFTTCGTWLPNDPRGSWSAKVYARKLRELGDVASHGPAPDPPPQQTVQEFHWRAETRLARDPVRLTRPEIQVVGESLGHTAQRREWPIWALAVLADHVHLVMPRDRHRIEYMVNQLKGGATRALGRTTTLWTRKCWSVFLDDVEAISAAIEYVVANPVRAGLGPQDWPFVIRFDGHV